MKYKLVLTVETDELTRILQTIYAGMCHQENIKIKGNYEMFVNGEPVPTDDITDLMVGYIGG